MKSSVLALLVLCGLSSGCVETDTTTTSSVPADCIEFDHVTNRDGRYVVCRMLWCEKPVSSTSGSRHHTGGVSALWCSSDIDGGEK